MRNGTALILLGITAMVAYSVGRQNVPSSSAPVAVMTSPPMVMAQAPNSSSPTPSAKPDLSDKPARPDDKRKVEAALIVGLGNSVEC
jgi:hypothetical protein